MPSTRKEFWEPKLLGNRERDAAAVAVLREAGWRVLLVWECFLRETKEDATLSKILTAWVEGEYGFGELSRGDMLQGNGGAPQCFGQVKNEL